MSQIMGGEFAISDELLVEGRKPCENIMLSSGRGALVAILQEIEEKIGKKGRIFLPNYLCESITNVVRDIAWKYEFYHVNSRMEIELDRVGSQINGFDVILLINYFGLTPLKETIEQIRERASDIVIVEDDVQAFYELHNTRADYSFTSLRKWFPCPDGAIIHANLPLRCEEEIKENQWGKYKFAGNILKNYVRHFDEHIALGLLEQGEQMLDADYCSSCSEVSKIIFSNLELKKIADKRRKNAQLLHNELEKMKIAHGYCEDAVPLFVPIFIKNRDELRQLFFSKEIFVPKHWPVISEEINGNNSLYDTELSLLCDQRYGASDMMRQIEVLREFVEGR